jgi:hypothetical protein
MRTKSLLLTAVLTAAGLVTASAQVFSVNVVGYINVTAPPGFSIFANQLDNGAGNLLGDLIPAAPAGATVFKFTGAGFESATYDDLDEAWDNPNITLAPGEAAWMLNPEAAPVTLTFVGEVMQGNLSNPLPAGFSMKSSMVPQAGLISSLGLVAEAGDTIFLFRNGAYVSSTYDDLDEAWGAPEPDPAVGEGFWFSTTTAREWTRQFSVE